MKKASSLTVNMQLQNTEKSRIGRAEIVKFKLRLLA